MKTISKCIVICILVNKQIYILERVHSLASFDYCFVFNKELKVFVVRKRMALTIKYTVNKEGILILIIESCGSKFFFRIPHRKGERKALGFMGRGIF